MMVYLWCFFLSGLFLWMSDHMKGWQKRVCVMIALLFPTVLAGCRGVSVGTDVSLYGKSDYNRAFFSDSLSGYMLKTKDGMLNEPLYRIALYFMSRISDSWHFGMFVWSLLTVGFCYLGMSRLYNLYGFPVWLGMVLWYLSYYNTSLNLIRQSIAVSVVFYAVTWLFEGRYGKYSMWTLVAVGFHTSAVFSFLVLPMWRLLRERNNVAFRKQVWHGVLFLGGVLGGLMFGETVVRFLVSAGILRDAYLVYFSGGVHAGSSLSVTAVIVYTGYTLVYGFHLRHTDRDRENLFFLAVSMFVVLSRFGQLISVFLPRVGFFFLPLQAASFSGLSECYDTRSRKTWILFIVGCFLAAWFVMFVMKGSSGTVPYVFDISS